MREIRRQTRAICVMELKDREEGLFVAYIEEARGMQVCQAVNERGRSTECDDQTGHVLGDEECIHPCAPLVRFMAIGIEIAGSEIIQRRAERRVLESERAVEIARLEEPHESTIDGLVGMAGAVAHVRRLVGIVHVSPVLGSGEVFLCIRRVAEPGRHGCDAEIVVCVFHGSRY